MQLCLHSNILRKFWRKERSKEMRSVTEDCTAPLLHKNRKCNSIIHILRFNFNTLGLSKYQKDLFLLKQVIKTSSFNRVRCPPSSQCLLKELTNFWIDFWVHNFWTYPFYMFKGNIFQLDWIHCCIKDTWCSKAHWEQKRKGKIYAKLLCSKTILCTQIHTMLSHHLYTQPFKKQCFHLQACSKNKKHQKNT